MKVIKLEIKDPYLYHLDCVMHTLANDKALICTDVVSKDVLKEIEKYVEIISVSRDYAYDGITNCVRLGKFVMCASHISELKRTDEQYAREQRKNEFLEKICAEYGYEPVFFNLSEFIKSGAMLSCCVMHLAYSDNKSNQLIRKAA